MFILNLEPSLSLLTVTRKRLASWITSLALCLWTERLQQHKRKTSVREGRHVRWASVAALEFFFFLLHRDHMTEEEPLNWHQRASDMLFSVLNNGEMRLKHSWQRKRAWRVTQIGIHPSGCGRHREQTASLKPWILLDSCLFYWISNPVWSLQSLAGTHLHHAQKTAFSFTVPEEEFV